MSDVGFGANVLHLSAPKEVNLDAGGLRAPDSVQYNCHNPSVSMMQQKGNRKV